MAELTFPAALAAQRLPQGYGNAGADEAAMLGAYVRGIRGDPGIALPQIMQARRLRMAGDDAVAQQTADVNRQNQQMYGDYIGRAEGLQQSKQAIDLLNARKEAPITGVPQLRKFITPGTEGAFQSVDELNFEKGQADADKTASEALAQRATAANNADQAGYGIDPRLLRLGNFTKGLGRQERVENIKGGYDLQKERIKGDADKKAKVVTKINEFNMPETVVTGGDVASQQEMVRQLSESKAPASGRGGTVPRANVTQAQKRIENHLTGALNAKIVGQNVVPNGDKGVSLYYKVKLPDGQTRDVIYDVGSDGEPVRRGR